MPREQVAPSLVADALQGGGRLHDVGEQQRDQDPLAGPRRRSRVGARAGKIERHPCLVAHDPGFVTGRNLVDLVRAYVELRAILQLDVQDTGQSEPHVMVRAALRPDRRSDIDGPSPARFHDHPPDHDVVELKDLRAPPRQVWANLIRVLELLVLEAGHGGRHSATTVDLPRISGS